jgi:UDP-N-acetyl-D-mannosaminuronic acid dehydrogenase
MNPEITKPKIAMVGLGYVGLTLGITLADLGFEVRGYDVNEKIRDSVQHGKPHFYEEGLKELLERNIDKNFTVVDSLSKENSADVYIVSVGTPLDLRNRPNLSYISEASAEIGQVLKSGDIVVLRSTVPMGTTRNVVGKMLEKKSGLTLGKDFSVAFAPERTIEGEAIKELRSLPQVVGGFDAKTTEKMAELFRVLSPVVIELPSLEEAEMVKLVNNTYRDVVFGFANEISIISRKWGLDTKRVIEAANFGYERSRVPMPSPGVGGYCLPKDSFLLKASGELKGYTSHIAEQARESTATMLDSISQDMLAFIKEKYPKAKSVNVLLLGFAFKGKPATSDTRGSSTLSLMKRLEKKSVFKVFGYDPLVSNDSIQKFGATPVSSIEEGINTCEIIVVMNNSVVFEHTDMHKLLEKVNRPVLLYDTWSLYPAETLAPLSHVRHSRL